MTPEEKEIAEKIRLYSQKHILPLYLKDECGNLKFQATLTLVEYKERYFALTAYHAIEGYNLERGLFANGTNISGLTLVHDFPEIDLAILDFHTKHFDGDRIYFNLNLDIDDYSLFIMKAFSWSGFPAARSRDFNKKDPQNEIINSFNNGLITTAKSLLVGIPFQKKFDNQQDHILGYHSLKNVEYAKEGKKSKGYSFKGMSGGALCLHKKQIEPIMESLFFIGIGLEHRKNDQIMGLSRKAIIMKLDEIIKQPIEFSLLFTHQ